MLLYVAMLMTSLRADYLYSGLPTAPGPSVTIDAYRKKLRLCNRGKIAFKVQAEVRRVAVGSNSAVRACGSAQSGRRP